MPGAFFRAPFCGSKVGATFRLARISIGSGLKPRASQRCRNTLLTLTFGAPANFLGEPQPPPPCRVRGRGDGERSHGPKLNNNVNMLYMLGAAVDELMEIFCDKAEAILCDALESEHEGRRDRLI
jgi:hypothetical protein